MLIIGRDYLRFAENWRLEDVDDMDDMRFVVMGDMRVIAEICGMRLMVCEV